MTFAVTRGYFLGSCAISLNLCYKSQFITIAKTNILYRNSKTASFVSSIFPNLIFCFSYFRAAFETLKLHHYNDGRKTEVNDPDYGLNVPKSSNADQSPTPQGSKKIGKKYEWVIVLHNHEIIVTKNIIISLHFLLFSNSIRRLWPLGGT